jgi:hypothetical protein
MGILETIFGIIGAVGTIGGAIGGGISRGNAAASGEGRDRMIAAELDRLGLPELKEYIPEFLAKSDAGELQSNPEFQRAQMAALDKLKQVSDEGGFTMADKAALNRVQGDIGQQQAAARAGLEQQMQARGALDSGAHLQMALANQLPPVRGSRNSLGTPT